MYWWGYSEIHGWVVLDRTIPCNGPGLSGDLLFYRCDDLQTFSVPRHTWAEPNYFYFEKYLKGRTKDDTVSFESLRCEIEPRLEAIQQENLMVELEQRRLQALRNHQDFLKSKGLQFRGVAARNANKYHRMTHCYSCKDSLDNEMDSECTACRWIICGCGACGCGYSRV